MAVLAFLICGVVGWYGAFKTYKVFWGGEDSLFFRPFGAALFVACGAASFTLYAAAERSQGTPFGLAWIATMILMAPFGAYFAGLAVTAGQAFFSTTGSIAELHSYNLGDGAMARQDFAEAVRCYRQDLARWPGEIDAVLRLARALEAAGDARMASLELVSARLDLLKEEPSAGGGLTRPGVSGPGTARRERNERVLLLTYALGDLYAGPLQEPDRARRLYEETLEVLYGFPGVDPLRDRLKVLAGATALGEAG